MKYHQEYSNEQRLLTLSQMKDNYEQTGRNQMMSGKVQWRRLIVVVFVLFFSSPRERSN